MKYFASLIILFGLAGVLRADIQDPPSNDYGPTRKLGRGLSNFFLAPAEAPVTLFKVIKDEGDNAIGYAAVRGAGRVAARHFAGILEIITFPFPVWRDSYYPLLPDETRYIHAGYSEFPPEIGNNSKYPYVRDTSDISD
jgi:putative exosortase-associated protein (TIGR04073 family)